jgi:hypothetical protein
MGGGERFRNGDFSARDAAGGIMQLAEIGNHRWKSEKTTLGGDELQEFGGQAGNTSLIKHST